LFNKNFPFVTLSKQRAKDKNWITSALKISSRHKNKLYKKWLTTKRTENEVIYIECRKLYNKLADEAERQCYREMFDRKCNSVK
jgi:hypothetical protein